MEKVSTIINIVLYALALAIGIIGAILIYLEIFEKESFIIILCMGVAFLAIAGLNSVNKD
jgi:hypothetical protein